MRSSEELGRFAREVRSIPEFSTQFDLQFNQVGHYAPLLAPTKWADRRSDVPLQFIPLFHLRQHPCSDRLAVSVAGTSSPRSIHGHSRR